MKRPHTNLKVWSESMILVKDIYHLTANISSNEKFGLTGQLKRTVISIPANIAEGAARQTKKEFKHFLYISRDSLNEVDTLVKLSAQSDFVQKKLKKKYLEIINKMSALLNGLIKLFTPNLITLKGYWRNINIASKTLKEGLKLTAKHMKNATSQREPLAPSADNYFEKENALFTVQYEVLPVPAIGRYKLQMKSMTDSL